MTGSFPLIFLFCLRWRECWIRSDPSVIVIITWNINANEDVCQRVNEGSLMWLSGCVHRQTRVLCLFEPVICLQAFAFIRGCLQICLVGVSHDFIIKRATLSLVFLSGNKRHRYFHESFDTWIMETIMLWGDCCVNVSLKANERFMMEMFCARDFKAFPVLLYRFAKKTFELCCGLFLNADSATTLRYYQLC